MCAAPQDQLQPADPDRELAAAMAGDGIIHHALRFTIQNNRIRDHQLTGN